MRASYRGLVILAVPTIMVLVKVPFLLGTAGLYGLDPYVHLYVVKMWLRFSGWPLVMEDVDVVSSDYFTWPGAHALAGSVSTLGVDPMDAMAAMPLVMTFLLVLAIELVMLRRSTVEVAAVTGVLFGLADYIFLQTMWYTPELIGLAIIAVLVLNELSRGSLPLSFLLLTGLLVTHHLSFLLGVFFWLLVFRGRFDRWRALATAGLVVETLLYWGFAIGTTGSFPDMGNQAGGLPVPVIGAVAIVGLAAGRWVLEALHGRYIQGREGESPLDIASSWLGRGGRAAVLATVAIVAVGILAVYFSSLSRLDGIGVQPSKLLVLGGGVLFLAHAPSEGASLRVLSVLGLLLLLFALNPVLFGFIPLYVRFLEFLYLPAFILLAVGVHSATRERAGRLRAVLVALLLIAPVLLADDALRYGSDGSQRFTFTQEDLTFAEAVGDATEEDALVVVPFNLAGVVWGIAERDTRTFPVRVALDNTGYGDVIGYLEDYSERAPVYLLHSSRRLLYMETEDDPVTDEDVSRLHGSLSDVPGRFQLVFEEGDHALYRFR